LIGEIELERKDKLKGIAVKNRVSDHGRIEPGLYIRPRHEFVCGLGEIDENKVNKLVSENKMKRAVVYTEHIWAESPRYDRVWMPDEESLRCSGCDALFTFMRRRHHCRSCGMVFCRACCNKRSVLSYSPTPVRVCEECSGN